MVARLDGRSFTRLTKEVHQFEAPFDERFRDLMLDTVEHLMTCGFNMLYGFTESDEISLLFSPDENSFSRKLRKLISILAGRNQCKVFARPGRLWPASTAEFPSCRPIDLVVDYFRWRNEDAHRNALNAHCYWCLRKDGLSVEKATTSLERVSVAEKNEMLFQHGINFNDLPSWQKRGIGIYWEEYDKPSENP